MFPAKKIVASGNGSEEPDAGEPVAYTEESLNRLTIDQIKGIAAERGYTITKTLKADIIAEFLEQQ